MVGTSHLTGEGFTVGSDPLVPGLGLAADPGSELVKFTGEEGKEVRPCGCDAGRGSK